MGGGGATPDLLFPDTDDNAKYFHATGITRVSHILDDSPEAFFLCLHNKDEAWRNLNMKWDKALAYTISCSLIEKLSQEQMKAPSQ